MKTDREIANIYRDRIRKQNAAAREKWDMVSCRLPKGTADRVKAQGETVNGFINKCVLDALDRLENAQTATQAPQTDEKKAVEQIPKEETQKAEEPKEEPPKEIKWLTKEELAALPKPENLFVYGLRTRPYQDQTTGAIMWEDQNGGKYDSDGVVILPF